jgi:hypothetical protein
MEGKSETHAAGDREGTLNVLRCWTGAPFEPRPIDMAVVSGCSSYPNALFTGA